LNILTPSQENAHHRLDIAIIAALGRDGAASLGDGGEPSIEVPLAYGIGGASRAVAPGPAGAMGPIELVRLLNEPISSCGETVVGMWRDSGTIAFVWCNLHASNLLQRVFGGTEDTLYSTNGGEQAEARSFEVDVDVDGIDPRKGLHDYSLALEFDCGEKHGSVLTEVFKEVDFVRRHGDEWPVEMIDGNVFLRCQLINPNDDDSGKHLRFEAPLNLEWNAGAMTGRIPRTVLANVTVLDENGDVFSSMAGQPIALERATMRVGTFSSAGDQLRFQYVGPGSCTILRGVIVVGDEDDQEDDTATHTLLGLDLLVRVSAVNNHFGTKYAE
jgi:hypothetical protein